MEPGDSVLLRRWRDGDKVAGKQLFHRYFEPVKRFFRSKLAGDVADLVQDTFAACVAGRERLSDDTNFRSYLFRVAYNVLAEHLRSKYRGHGSIDIDDISMAALEPGPSSVVARRQEERLLLEALRAIPVHYQILLELFYWESFKSIEIAAVVALPHGTVRTQLRRARELLEGEMARLASSTALLESTLTRLDDWARSCREQLGQAS